MALGDEQIGRFLTGIDTISRKRVLELDAVFKDNLGELREMLNGFKATVNVEMPVVKKAEPVKPQ